MMTKKIVRKLTENVCHLGGGDLFRLVPALIHSIHILYSVGLPAVRMSFSCVISVHDRSSIVTVDVDGNHWNGAEL